MFSLLTDAFNNRISVICLQGTLWFQTRILIGLLVLMIISSHLLLEMLLVILITAMYLYAHPKKAHKDLNIRPSSTPNLCVVSSNLLMDNPISASTIKALTSSNPDILITIETTTAILTSLTPRLKDYSQVSRGGSPVGEMIVIWANKNSPYTCTQAAPVIFKASNLELPAVIVRGFGRTFTVVGVHIHSPKIKDAISIWHSELYELAVLAENSTGNLILAGDFNASLEHKNMRNLARVLKDAGAVLGSSLRRTWPCDGNIFGKFLPFCVLGLDHALVSDQIEILEYKQLHIPGSDHKGILVRFSGFE
jgi:endonuclease/exonuclease/phosphatase (EEP) superfamily protein YafD